MKNRGFTLWMAAHIVSSVLLLQANAVIAQTHVYVQNNTSYDFEVHDIVASGDAISKKAWQEDALSIPHGKRSRVLILNRSGKVNWMDPTPRFIEPGKTAVFTTIIKIKNHPETHPIILKQKLLGVGKSSKMWHSIEGAENLHYWENDANDYHGIWKISASDTITFLYRAFATQNNTHIEYIFAGKDP